MENLKHFKNLLEVEAQKLETELKTVGRKNSNGDGEWEATEKMDIDPADEDEVADSIEEYENNSGIVNQLNSQLVSVVSALQKIEDGTYGKCEVCGENIEEDRLEANPSATTCKLHM